jgi:hypothetical protein
MIPAQYEWPARVRLPTGTVRTTRARSAFADRIEGRSPMGPGCARETKTFGLAIWKGAGKRHCDLAPSLVTKEAKRLWAMKR